jgi:hypothetical protein
VQVSNTFGGGEYTVRMQYFAEPRPPEDIPIAGVTLADLLGEAVSIEEAQLALDGVGHKNPNAVIQSGDALQRFRTPPWTWANMGGMEAIAVLRSGRVAFWVVTRMN